jgi:hypothetical protein
MLKSVFSEIDKANAFVSTSLWMDFEVFEMKSKNLTLIGSADFSYFHEIEITFGDVFYLQLIDHWCADTSRPFLKIMTGAEFEEFNLKNTVEVGNIAVELNSDCPSHNLVVACKRITVKIGKVWHIRVDSLAEGETIADWAK